jgi:hypothetical protein
LLHILCQANTAGSECSGYEPARLERPKWRIQAVIIPWMSSAIRQHRQQQAATDALRAGVLLHEYEDQSTNSFHHLHWQRQQATVIVHLQQQQGSRSRPLHAWQQADSIFVNLFSADVRAAAYCLVSTAVPASLHRQILSDAQHTPKRFACPLRGLLAMNSLRIAFPRPLFGVKPGSLGTFII